ncbi:nuclear transport factor 2 family protein [Microlunatus sp. Gsoil 973]|jgi:predicted SnoaL-like aldol condensation-catalyzing enzyme|uniref:nuclear transport factor 2 family protein n=1 Tax=Microlunatus sp. Gsoil 973 TaxID=2672569 RepID=UPI0012B4D286|nr:nuclear transport factor 2 family protein [Microlunatus sp. Gsoil 973]QGN32219.1 polyketide cyclase [Microlunatus sp. Gsoil 973]
MSSTAERNKQAVREFYEYAINRKDFTAARSLIGDRYTQHNPRIADGVDGLESFIDELRTRFPYLRAEVKQLYADGDVVIGHVHGIRVPGQAGTAIIDIFRFDEDKIVEHWDVMQPLPDRSANPNGMF